MSTERGLGLVLKRAQHAYRTRIDDALRPLGLTAPQYAAMAAIKADEGISNADLARLAFVTAQSMSGLLANLERAGFLNRTPHAEHGRVLQNILTTKGRDVLRRADLEVDRIEALLVSAVGPPQVGVFADALTRCAERLAEGSA